MKGVSINGQLRKSGSYRGTKQIYKVGVVYFIKFYKIIKLNEIIKRKVPTQMEEWELILEYIDKSDDLFDLMI